MRFSPSPIVLLYQLHIVISNGGTHLNSEARTSSEYLVWPTHDGLMRRTTSYSIQSCFYTLKRPESKYPSSEYNKSSPTYLNRICDLPNGLLRPISNPGYLTNHDCCGFHRLKPSRMSSEDQTTDETFSMKHYKSAWTHRVNTLPLCSLERR